MSIAYFNLSSRKSQPKLFLCKPNKQIVSPLLDIYNLNLHMRLGAISEMSFSIPAKVERNHKLVDNPLINRIKDRYYLKMEFDNQVEYFVFLNQNRQIANDGKTITYRLYSTAYLLNDKYIYKLEETGWTLSQFAAEILRETNWRLEYVDADYDVKTRYMDISSKTVLQSLFDLAENFNAIILFDTRNERINFYNPSNIGLNKGLKINDKRFLESLNVETKADEMITRLHVYGKDGLNIRRLTPTGSDFIQDFSFFMHPFECDDNYNVLKSSEYMSDELCVSIVKYNELLSANGNAFDVLSSNASSIEARITLEKERLNTLETQLKVLLDERDVINATYGEAAPQRADHIAVTANINNKNAEIVAQNNVISQLYSNLSSVQTQIENLNNQLKMESNFTGAQLLELNKYIITKEHTNDSIVEEEDLLNEAFEVFETLNEPPINISLSIEGYLESLADGSQLQTIALGDVIRVLDDELGISYRLKILEIQFDFESFSINLTIANGKEVIDDNAKLVDMIYSANNTSTIVNMDKFKWNQGVTANDNVSRLLNSEWDAVKNAVLGGYNQTITISERGLIAKDITDPMNWLVLQNGVLAITNDNGNSWKTAITKNGIFAERIIGKLLIGNKLHIEDEEGIITITGGSQKVHDLNGNVRVEMGRFVDSQTNLTKYGLRVHSGSIQIVDGLPKSQIDPTAVEAWDSSEENAKAYTDALKRQIEDEIADVNYKIDNLDIILDDAFKDGIIEQSEANAIATYIQLLNKEKADVTAQYDYLLTLSSLPASYKSTLTITKNSYDTAFNNLISAIEDAIRDGKATNAEKQAIDTRFATFRTSSASLQTMFQTCLDAITNKLITDLNSSIRGDLRLTAPLPTSLTLDSSGITAYTSTTSNYARLDYRGLYVQGGALDIRTGAASNTGVIINGTGIKGYNSGGNQTLNIDATSGRVTISGAFTIQSSYGSNNIIRLSESGLYAYDVTGNTKFSLSTSGTAYFSGSISASTISGGSISGTSVSASSISGGTISAASISGGTISGTSISGGSLTGTTIQTSTLSNYGLKIDSNGLSLFDSSGTRKVYLSSTGSATFAGNISGSTITSSTITSSDINVSSTVTIGNELILGGSNQGSANNKRIRFANNAQIYGVDVAGLFLSASYVGFDGEVSFRSTTSVDFTGATVKGLTANSTAVFG